jgi:hypothetical protein
MSKQKPTSPPAATAPASKPTKHRSPNFPSLSLRIAVSKMQGLFNAMKRHSVGVEIAVQAMGYSYKSSTGKLALASMRAYGFFENTKEGSGSTVKLSTRGLDIAVDYPAESEQWWTAVKKAALEPKVHAILWKKYGDSLPADDELRRFLARDLGFNDNAVGPFIRDYKDTIDFAKLTSSDTIDDSDLEDDDKEDDDEGHSGGRNQTKKNRKKMPGTKEDVFTLSHGDVVLQWPDTLTQDEYDDTTGWLDLIKRKLKRSVVAEGAEVNSLNSEEDES